MEITEHRKYMDIPSYRMADGVDGMKSKRIYIRPTMKQKGGVQTTENFRDNFRNMACNYDDLTNKWKWGNTSNNIIREK